MYDPEGQAWRVRARYAGHVRPLDKDELKFVREWLKSTGHQDQNALFVNAYLFQDFGVDYWLPVQAPVARFFPRALKAGQLVDLYILDLGGARGKRGWNWLPVVEEFKKPN